MKRRGFLAALAAIPFLRRFAKAAPVPTIDVNVGGSHQACAYVLGMALDPWGAMKTDSGRPAFIVTAVDYERGIVTLRTCPFSDAAPDRS